MGDEQYPNVRLVGGLSVHREGVGRETACGIDNKVRRNGHNVEVVRTDEAVTCTRRGCKS